MTSQNIENMIIIGSGPAWHTAAIYAWRAMLRPLMFEWLMAGGIAAGWQLTTTTEVENFPWFPDGIQWPDLMLAMRQQSVNSDTRIQTRTVDRVDLSQPWDLKVYVGDQEYRTKTLVISTGATAKKLNVPWVDKYRNRGISGCATCDGALPIFRNKDIAIIGGGDVAMEEALHLTKYGSHVYVYVRRDVLRASKVMADRALAHEKITFVRNTEVQEVLWNDKKITGLRLLNNKTGEEYTQDVWWLFFAIGHTPNTRFLWGQVQTDDTGYIMTKPGTTRTSVPGVFAAWDVQDKVYRQAITSAGTGCMAALEAQHWIESQN